jgi:hypothetical protein
MRGTVIGGVPAADNDEGKTATKKSETKLLGVVDTAFNPQVRRVTKYADRVAASQRR